jgi:two-component system OmpR family response regulator
MKLLVIEDSEILCRNIVRYMSSRDIHVDVSLDWQDWLYKASINTYDAIILDINLPIINGLDVCKKLREKEVSIPVIMLTSNSWNNDIISGLWAWADDYLSKPFEYPVLFARLEAITRRNFKNKSVTIIELNNNIIINLEKHNVTYKWENIFLSVIEFNLFKFLAQNKSKAMSREKIYQNVWWEMDNDFIFSKTIDVHIWYLRKKLWKDIIKTRKGFWYIIE